MNKVTSYYQLKIRKRSASMIEQIGQVLERHARASNKIAQAVLNIIPSVISTADGVFCLFNQFQINASSAFFCN